MAPPKGATTPYFAFVNDNRAAAKAALLEAGAPAGMGDVGKELGARWRALSDEEKKVYVDQVAAAKEAAKEAAGEEDGGAAREAPDEDAGPVTLPLARVKRIIRLDPDVKQTQLDAVRLISRATELFVESLTAGAYGMMKGTKRKTIKFSDIEQHVMRRNKLKFMHDHIAATATQSAKTKDKDGGASGAGRAAGAAGEAGAAGGSKPRSISTFFTPAAAGAADKAADAAAGGGSADASDAEPSADEDADGVVGEDAAEPSGADESDDDDA